MNKEFEKDFEISMLSHAREVLEVPSLAGIFQKDSQGKYTCREVRIAFNAYCMAMKHRLDVAEQCKPDRHISSGMITQLQELIDKPAKTEQLFADVLKAFNDGPVT